MRNIQIDQCASFINSQTATPGAVAGRKALHRAVTISRQTGCGGVPVAEKLVAYLQARQPGEHGEWTIFDRELMERVLSDHQLPKYLADFLPEDRVSRIEDILADIFCVHPPVQTLVEQTAETIRQLVELGQVILIGRAGNVITAGLPHVLHVRLVGSLEDRVERICRDFGKSPDAARRFCLEEDHARARYVKTYYQTDIADPLQYHLVINTSRTGYEHAARLIGEAVLQMAD
jgi:hypothetical protein